jgi:preprotein translocase SecF subunit
LVLTLSALLPEHNCATRRSLLRWRLSLGILVYIAMRFEWTYGAAAVIAVFHDVLITLGFFSAFQWEVSLTVIAALLTLVGFSVNDTIVVFDRIREKPQAESTRFSLQNNQRLDKSDTLKNRYR